MKQLKNLQSKFPMIGDVRGKGLMIGVEFVKENARPNPKQQKLSLLQLSRKRIIDS